jgi:hypothetical protein
MRRLLVILALAASFVTGANSQCSGCAPTCCGGCFLYGATSCTPNSCGYMNRTAGSILIWSCSTGS